MQFNTGSGNQHDEDDYDDYEDEEPSSRGFLRVVSAVFVIGALTGFVALAWYAYNSGQGAVDEADIPMVAEDGVPLKEAPQDPGGWQFEHQDKSVYNQLAAGKGGDSAPVAERIMPPVEEPVQRADLPPEPVLPAPGSEQPVAPVAEQEISVQSGTAASEVESVKEAPVQPVEQEKPVATNTVIPWPVDDEPAAAPAKAAEVAAPAPVKEVVKEKVKEQPKAAESTGKFMVQLGAFSSDAEAEKAWSKINAAHGSKFPTKNHKVARADLGAKGVFYRLQMGPFETETAARKVCSYLQENKQACLFVKQ